MRSNWANSTILVGVDPDAYKEQHPKLIRYALEQCNARVAVPDAPDSDEEIAGWMVSELSPASLTVHYCNTPKIYRRMGVQRLLLKDAGWNPGTLIVATHATHVNTEWRALINHYNPKTDPYRFYRLGRS